MLSDNDKKKLDNIKNGLKSIEANLDNLGFVYKVASNLFRLSDNLDDSNLKSNIKSEATKITHTQYREEIQQAVKSILVFISDAEKSDTKVQNYFIEAIIRKDYNYLKDCEKYSNYKKNIEELERKITTAENYQKKLHEKIISGEKWEKHCHARLTGNLRVMYSWDPNTKILKFKRILTKNELEKD